MVKPQPRCKAKATKLGNHLFKLLLMAFACDLFLVGDVKADVLTNRMEFTGGAALVEITEQGPLNAEFELNNLADRTATGFITTKAEDGVPTEGIFVPTILSVFHANIEGDPADLLIGQIFIGGVVFEIINGTTQGSIVGAGSQLFLFAPAGPGIHKGGSRGAGPLNPGEGGQIFFEGTSLVNQFDGYAEYMKVEPDSVPARLFGSVVELADPPGKFNGSMGGAASFTFDIFSQNQAVIPEIPKSATLPILAFIGLGIFWMRNRSLQ